MEAKDDERSGDQPRCGDQAAGVADQIAPAVENLRQGIGREENFRLLFDHYYAPVHKYFATRLSSSEDRLDLTQEVFLRVYRGIEGYRGEANFGTWLFQIAHNTYLKWLRRAELERTSQAATFEATTSSAEVLRTGSDDDPVVVTTHETPLEEVLDREKKEKLREAIDELPEQMRWCTRLRVYQELSYGDIAVTMRLSIETVKVHLFQARRKLKERLRDSFEGIEI